MAALVKMKKVISAALACGLIMGQAACLSGCGEQPAVADEVIELIEPTGELSGSEAVTRRNLYLARAFEVMVDPYIEEYSYEEARNFVPTGRKIGDRVAAGDIIYRANILSHEPQMEKLSEKLAGLEESYAEYYYEIRTKLNDQYWDLKVLDWELEQVQDAEPKEQSGPAYDAWKKEEDKAIGYYNKKELDIEMNEAALRERTELLYLDYDYYAKQLQELQRQDEAGDLRSGISGQIVYLEACDEGEQIRAGTVVASVADMNRKRIVCNAIDSTVRYTIKEIYAFFNGKRYEVVYDEESSSSTSSVFILQDPRGEVPVGSYGNLVLYSGVREQVLTVPSEAVHNAGLEKYVYVLEGGKTVSKTVRVGLTDGVYIEILSGLEEGESVFLDKSAPRAVNTAALQRGSVSVRYSQTGTLYYPIEFDVGGDVQNGTVTFQSWAPYESVVKGNTYTFDRLADAGYMPMKAGDIIAHITVLPSDIEKQELIQLENDLKRAQERLADLIKKETESDEGLTESSEKLIAARQEAIDDMEEELAGLREDYSVTDIRTQRDGLLYYINDRIYYQQGGSNSRVGISVVPGDKMDRNYVYARMIDNSIAYLLLPEKALSSYVGYNMTMTVSYVNWEYETVAKEVPVITVNMDKYKHALLLDRELLQDINIYKTSYQSSFNKQTSLEVDGKVKVMNDVLLLPEKAISMVNGSFGYVNVLKEDGSILPTSVVVGGKYLNEDREYSYCVIDGLTEGMTICWE